MNSRELIHLTLNHKQPDRVPFDLGGTFTTGMHVSSVYLLRQALSLDPPDTPVKIIEPHQMLGEIKPDLMDILGVDVIGVWPKVNIFGFQNDHWKPWRLFDGTPVLVPNAFNTKPTADGSILIYPGGDYSAEPCAHMPQGSYYFDIIPRPNLPDNYPLNIEDNLEEFGLISENNLAYFTQKVEKLYLTTDKAIVLNIGGTAFGNIALVPAPWLPSPRGIRNIEDWYMSLAYRKTYIYQVFEKQCEIALKNLERVFHAIGNKVSVIYMSGADYGIQTGPLISVNSYRQLFKPFQKQLNDWIHQNTSWKTFIHSCGSIAKLLPDIIEAGFDIINPVQTSAAGMDAQLLKDQFGEKVTFWGGGVDTQEVLPFKSPEEIRAQVKERLNIFNKGGGYIFNPIHNIQPNIPVENIIAVYQAFHEYNRSKENTSIEQR